MRRRGVITVLGVLAAGLVGVVAGRLLKPSPPPKLLTVRQYYRVRVGYPLAEAEAILGPRGDYRSQDSESDKNIWGEDLSSDQYGWTDPQSVHTKVSWIQDGAKVVLVVDASGNVTEKAYYRLRKIDHGSFGHLRWMAERLRQRWQP